MLSKKEVRKLDRICPTARWATFGRGGEALKAVSVANRDLNRRAVAEILEGHKPIWERGEDMSFIPRWAAERLWFERE